MELAKKNALAIGAGHRCAGSGVGRGSRLAEGRLLTALPLVSLLQLHHLPQGRLPK